MSSQTTETGKDTWNTTEKKYMAMAATAYSRGFLSGFRKTVMRIWSRSMETIGKIHRQISKEAITDT